MTTTLTPLTDVDRLFRTLWNAPAVSEGFAPAADLYRDGEDLVARFDLPGIDPAEDVTVEVEGRKLVVRGERKDSREDGQNGHRVHEVRYGSFRRTVTLPKAVEADAVSASYDAGVLTVTVAGVYAGTTPSRIEVTTNGA
ncbi:MAG TPA: Hsp20/alpha crystallin family protein [Jiangellaceae bacterium]